MSSDAFSELVAHAVAEAQRPLVGALEELRTELAEARRELQVLRETSREQPPAEADLVYLSLPQVAARLGVSKRTARRWIDSGKLPHVRLPGGGVRISAAELERVLTDSSPLASGDEGVEEDARH